MLETSGNGEKLQELLSRLPKCEELENHEGILKAKATAAFFRGDFRELYKVRWKIGGNFSNQLNTRYLSRQIKAIIYLEMRVKVVAVEFYIFSKFR